MTIERAAGSRTAEVREWPSSNRWTLACAVAETIGMTAAACAAVATRHLASSTLSDRLVVLAVIVAGGLVEGAALGGFQARALRDAPGIRRRRWFLVTLLVAGVGWAAASAPSALSSSNDDQMPPLLLVLGGAAALGAVMGAVLGAVQVSAIDGIVVRHRWRWAGVSALAWIPAMVIIFVGASMPASTWGDLLVIAIAPPTGLLAGWALGRMSAWLLPSLTGAHPHDLFVLRLLISPFVPLLGRRLLGLRFQGAVSGRTIELPVEYARYGAYLVVMPGHPETKHWWHNLEGHLTEVEVLIRHTWTSAVGEVVTPVSSSYDTVRKAYLTRWPSAEVPEGQPFVQLYGLSP